MRRWWLVVVMIFCANVQAMSWDDLWYNKNQQAIRAYRAKKLEQAQQYFGADKSPTGHYNRGNALAHQKKLKEAINAYELALKQKPDLEDAKFNRDLLKKLLEQQKKQQNQQKQQQQNKQNQQQGDKKQQQQQASKQKKQQDKQSQQSKDKQQKTQAKHDNKEQKQEQQQAQSEQQQREREQKQSQKQVLRRIPDDPGGLLRRKFMRDYQRRQMESSPW